MRLTLVLFMILVASATGPRTDLTKDEKVDILDLVFRADDAMKRAKVAGDAVDARVKQLQAQHAAEGCTLTRSLTWDACPISTVMKQNAK